MSTTENRVRVVYEGDSHGAVVAGQQTTASLKATGAALDDVTKHAKTAKVATAEVATSTRAAASSADHWTKGAKQNAEGMAKAAGAANALSAALGTTGTEFGKVTQFGGQLLGVIGTGGALTIGIGLAAIAMAGMNRVMEEQERKARDLEAAWRGALQAFIDLRNEQSQRRLDAEDEQKATELEALGNSPKVAAAMVRQQKAAATEAQKLAAASQAYAAAIEAANVAADAQLQKVKNVEKAIGETSAAEKNRDIEKERAAAIEAAAKTYATQANVARQRANDAERELRAIEQTEKLRKGLDEVKRKEDEAAKNAKPKRDYEAEVLADLEINPPKGWEPESLLGPVDAYDEYVAAEEALREARMYGADEATLAALQARADAELMASSVDLVGQAYEDARRSADEMMQQIAPGIGAVGAAAIKGSGGAAAGSMLGGTLGSATSMALGDPTGMIGGSIGAALGELFGQALDSLTPVAEIAHDLADALGILAQATEPLWKPLEGFGEVLKQAATFIAPVIAQFHEALTGPLLQSVMLGTALVATLMEALYPLTPLFWSMQAALFVLDPVMNALSDAMVILYDAVLAFSRGILETARNLLADFGLSNDALDEMVRTLRRAKTGAELRDGLGTYDPIDPGDDANTDALNANTDALESFNDSMMNMPAGFKREPGQWAATAPGAPNITIIARGSIADEIAEMKRKGYRGIQDSLGRFTIGDERN